MPKNLWLDAMAIRLFGWTADQAREGGVCVRCLTEVDDLSELDLDEYRLSALCPDCFNLIMPEYD